MSGFSHYGVISHIVRSLHCSSFFFFNDTATTEIYTLSLHDALPIFCVCKRDFAPRCFRRAYSGSAAGSQIRNESGKQSCGRSEEHTSELQSRLHLVCRLLLEKKKKLKRYTYATNTQQ